MTNAISQQSNTLQPALPSLLKRLWRHLSVRRQRQFGLLLGLMLLSGFAEVISLGAVMPFLGVLIDPERVLGFPLVSGAASAIGITGRY